MTQFSPRHFQPWPMVVKNIIIINVLMVLLQYVLWNTYGLDLSLYLGLHYWQSPLFRWWQPLTHIFMHGSPQDIQQTFWHIAFNMFALWMFGRVLENVWGPKRFLIFYLVCGLGAGLCHMGVLTIEYSSFQRGLAIFQRTPDLDHYLVFIKNHHLQSNPIFAQIAQYWSANMNCSNCASEASKYLDAQYSAMINEATVGASGAVFGVLFAFGYLFPNTELMLIFPPIPVKAKWVVTVYALIELVQGLENSAGDNIAHFAHLGGMLFAFILLRIWRRNIRNSFY